MSRPWTTTELAQVTQGGCAVELARRLNRTVAAVQNAARRAGGKAPRKPHACYWSPQDRECARRMRRGGATVRHITEMMGIPMGTVRRWIYER